MKTVCITQRLLRYDRHAEIREMLDSRWSDVFNSMELLPIPLLSGIQPKQMLDNYMPDGIILSGGNDLSSCVSDDLSKKRDEYERSVLALAVEREIPVVGICRGMLLITEYFGGKIKQIPGHVAVRHRLRIHRAALWYNSVERIHDVNSYHRYVPCAPPTHFIIAATGEDGSIEAIEHDRMRIVGQMWHPEREIPCRNEELAVFRALLES